MKKFFLYAVALAATMSLTSCLSEEEVNLEKGNMGHIALNIDADNSLTTRADVTDVTAWYAFIDGSSTDFGTNETRRTIAELSDFDFPYGDYTVTVSSHPNLDAALSGKGEAFYEGGPVNDEGESLENVTVNAGSTTSVKVSCGKAKNARLAIVNTGFLGTITSVTAAAKMSDKTTAREVSFVAADVKTTEDASTKAFFRAGESVTFTFNYTIGTLLGAKTASIPMTMGGAGTKNVLNIKSDANGNIQIMQISYDDTWGDGRTETITISAETGEKI